MAENLGQAILELRTDDRKLRRGIRGAEQQARGLASTFRQIGSAIAVAFAGRELLQFGARAVQAASDVQEMQNLLAVTFGQATADVLAWSESTAEAVGRSRFELQKFAGDFASFLKPLGTAPDQIVPMTKALTQLTVDLASFRNLAEEDVFTKLLSGLAGETEAVRRLGIDLSATAVEQELLNQGVQRLGGEFTQAQKVAARYAIIMSQTADAQGDAARTADGLANQQRRLQGQLQDLQVAIGRDLLPVMLDLVGAIAAIIAVLPESINQVGFFTRAWVSLQQVIGVRALVVVRAVEVVARVNARLLESAALVITAFRDEAAEARRLADSIGIFADALRDANRDRIDKILEDATGVAQGLGDTIREVNVNVTGLGQGMSNLGAETQNLGEKAEEAGEKVEVLGGKFQGVIKLIPEVQRLTQGVADMADEVSRLASQPDIQESVGELGNLLEQVADDVGRALAEAIISGDVDNAIEGFGRALEAAAADALAKAIGDALSGAFSGAGVGVSGGGFGAALTLGIASLLFAGFTKTGPFREVEVEVRSIVAEFNHLGVTLLQLGESSDVAARSLSELNAAEAEMFSRIQASVSQLLTTLGVVIPEGFEKLTFSIKEVLEDGISQGFEVDLGLGPIGEGGAGLTRLQGEIQRTFATFEEALGFATREFLRHLIDQGVQIDAAVKELVQGEQVPLSLFAEAVTRVQGLADQARISLGGFSAIELALEKLPAQLQALRGELLTLGLSAAQVERLVGGQLIASMQALRQQITGEELSIETRKAIQKSQAQLFNAERALRIADLKARSAELHAQIGLTRAELELIRQGTIGYAEALKAKGAVYNAEVKLIIDQIKAINKIIEALVQIPEIDIGKLRLPGIPRVNVPRGGGVGGGGRPSLADQLAGLLDRLFPKAARAREYRENLSLLQRAFEKGLIGATRFKDAVKALAEQFTESLRDALRQIDDFGRSLVLRQDSPVPVGRQLLLAQQEVARQARLARETGDVSGFTSASSQLLDLAREVFGSTAGFQAIFRAIQEQQHLLERDIGVQLKNALPPAERTSLNTEEIAETSERIRENTDRTRAAVERVEQETGMLNERNQVGHGKTQFEIREADQRMQKRMEEQTREFVKAIERIKFA